MPLRFVDDPQASSVLASLGLFAPYSFQELRNRILFRLLARHGTIVASTLEFNATKPETLKVLTESISTYGGLEIKVDTLKRREFFQAPYLRNPYQLQSDGILVSRHGAWKSTQPLILGSSPANAQAALQLDRAHMQRGPFAEDSFEKDYELFKQPTLRYFVKHAPQRNALFLQIPSNELTANAPTLPTALSLGDVCSPEMIHDLWNVELVHQGVNRTVLGHLAEFHANPAAFPAWRDYATSEAREKHHLHKSFVRLDSHYEALHKRVGETTRTDHRPLTEARGEYLAAKVMAMVFAGEQFELKMGFGDKKRAQGIDQIWAKRRPDTKEIEAYFVVEAKGSKSAKHGQNKEETQMSPGWVFKKLLEQASSSAEDARVRRLATKVLGAMFDEGSQVAVYGMTLKSIYDKDHLAQTASRFNLQISKPLCFPELLKPANDTSLTIASEQELFGTGVFPVTQAARVDILSRVPRIPLRTEVSKDTHLNVGSVTRNHTRGKGFDILDAFHPEHTRNLKLLGFLSSRTAAILSVQDYFGVDPKTAKIGSQGTLTYFTGFASTVYGKGGHDHLRIEELVDPYDQDQRLPAVLMELDDRATAEEVLQWKQSNLRAPPPEPRWKTDLSRVTNPGALPRILEFFDMSPTARDELRRLMTSPEIKDPRGALGLTFPSINPDFLLRQVSLGGKKEQLWQYVIRLQGDRFQHHEAKSLRRLGQHYASLEKLVHTNESDTAVTEASGEFLGARAMAIIFGKDKLQLKMGHGEKKGSHGIDQIWVKRDESTGNVLTYFLVECKGSKQAELGQNKAETQMSPAWICKKLLELANDASQRLRSLARKILQAMFEPKGTICVFGVIIQSLYDGEKPKGRFNIRITSRLFFPDMLELANEAFQRGREKSDPHLNIRHDQMPLTRFVPEYKATPPPPRGPELLRSRPDKTQSRHLALPDYPLSTDHILQLERLKYTTLRVYADGDCTYNTVILWLKRVRGLREKLELTKLPSVEELKEYVVEVIDAAPDFARRFLEPGQDLEDLKKKVGQRSLFFGSHGDIVLPALAARLKLNIHILFPNGAVESLNESFKLGLPSTAPKVLAVLTTYLSNPYNIAHYYPAVPQPRSAPPGPIPMAQPKTANLEPPENRTKRKAEKEAPAPPRPNGAKAPVKKRRTQSPKKNGPPGGPPGRSSGGPKKGGPGGPPSGSTANL